jgi:hypothetical protein
LEVAREAGAHCGEGQSPIWSDLWCIEPETVVQINVRVNEIIGHPAIDNPGHIDSGVAIAHNVAGVHGPREVGLVRSVHIADEYAVTKCTSIEVGVES